MFRRPDHWVGLYAEADLGPVSRVVDVGSVQTSDDQDVDVIRRRTVRVVISLGPRAVDQNLLGVGQVETLLR